MTDPPLLHPAVAEPLAALGVHVVAAEPIGEGTVARTKRVTLDDGTTAVLKTRRSAPAEMWSTEAAGLLALQVPGGPAVPEVLAVGDTFLLIEYLPEPVPLDGPDAEAFWRTFAEQLAVLHAHEADAFGWDEDNFLGIVQQRNTRTTDGYRFYGEQRLLRYLDEPLVDESLTAEDRRDLERLVARLPELVPPKPPVRTHGDLWRWNVLAAGPGRPALCDPAVSDCWAEADLSMLWRSGGVPDAFFEMYHAIDQPEPGWEQRYRVLHLREVLSVIAHAGDFTGAVGELRATLADALR